MCISIGAVVVALIVTASVFHKTLFLLWHQEKQEDSSGCLRNLVFGLFFWPHSSLSAGRVFPSPMPHSLEESSGSDAANLKQCKSTVLKMSFWRKGMCKTITANHWQAHHPIRCGFISISLVFKHQCTNKLLSFPEYRQTFNPLPNIISSLSKRLDICCRSSCFSCFGINSPKTKHLTNFTDQFKHLPALSFKKIIITKKILCVCRISLWLICF